MNNKISLTTEDDSSNRKDNELKRSREEIVWNITYLGNASDVQTYEERKLELIYEVKEQGCWQCKECPYARKQRHHVQEHSEKHILGFVFECSNCDGKYKRRGSLRHHLCKALE